MVLDFEQKEIVVSDSDIKTISTLAGRQIKLEDEIIALEDRIKLLMKNLAVISSDLLPNAMNVAGIENFKLKTGQAIGIKRVIKASIPKQHLAKALSWLRRNKHGSLIKNEVTARFGRGEEGKAEKLLKLCQKQGYEVGRKESVHAQTLGAFVREQLEIGRDIPMDLLGVFQIDISKITRVKE